MILTEHTNCERGYLAVLAGKLAARFGEALSVRCSERDRDPLQIR